MDIARERGYNTPLANSTLLPLMLMSLATQKNAPSPTQSPSTVNSEYDYIIVGAGSGGSTLAGRLSELPCVSILLLEAGGSPPILNDVPSFGRNFWFTDIDWAYKTVPQKHTGRLLTNRVNYINETVRADVAGRIEHPPPTEVDRDTNPSVGW